MAQQPAHLLQVVMLFVNLHRDTVPQIMRLPRQCIAPALDIAPATGHDRVSGVAMAVAGREYRQPPRDP